MFFKGNSSKKSKADVDSVVESTSVKNILLPDQTRPDDAVDEEGDFAASASRKRKAIDDGNEGGERDLKVEILLLVKLLGSEGMKQITIVPAMIN